MFVLILKIHNVDYAILVIDILKLFFVHGAVFGIQAKCCSDKYIFFMTNTFLID